MRERGTTVRPEWREECGWGAPGSEYGGVHFKTAVAGSLGVLERAALRRDEGLAGRAGGRLACDVEEYLGRIRGVVGRELDQDICRQYVAFYRNSRTAGRECSEREFRSFLGVFQEMLKRVER